MKAFNLNEAIEILERTPAVLEQLLTGLSDSWIYNNEGENTWSPFDIVGHLLHGEKTDWITRAKLVMKDEQQTFEPFDRFAQLKDSQGKSIGQLLAEFKTLRTQNLETLKKMNISEDHLQKTGIHPNLGQVTLKELLSTWVVHDLGHIRQMTRVMAKQYKNELGPWEKYLPVVHE